MRATHSVQVRDPKRLSRMIYEMASAEGSVIIEIPANRRYYRDSQGRRRKPISVRLVALINEYGSGDGHVPERPVLRPLMDTDAPTWQRSLLARALQTARNPKPGFTEHMKRLGAKIRNDIELAYLLNRTKPNAPATIARKGSSKPLIDTRILAKAWRVRWVSARRRVPGLDSLTRKMSQMSFAGRGR